VEQRFATDNDGRAKGGAETARYRFQRSATAQRWAAGSTAARRRLIGEFGIPYDLNGGESFKRWTDGERGAAVWQAQDRR